MRIHQNVNDRERVASIVAGAGLAALATKIANPRLRRSATGWGIWLVARGLSGLCPVNAALGRTRARRPVARSTKAALGGSRGLRLDASIRIDRSVDDVYNFWRDVRNFPLFMSQLERIHAVDDCRSHWVVRGPAGTTVEWDADVIHEEPPYLIAWQTLPDSDVASAGSVHFEPLASGGTQVDVVLQYSPPAGRVGAAAAKLTGLSPDSILREDLRRLKQLLESGRVGGRVEQSPTPGQPQRRRFSHQFSS